MRRLKEGIGLLGTSGAATDAEQRARRGGQGAGQHIAQSEVALPLANAIALAQVFGADDDVGHASGQLSVVSGQ